MRFLLTLVIGVISVACGSNATVIQQSYSQEEFISREGRLDGKVFKYRVYLPPNRDPNHKLPVMLYLHGAGNRGSDNESQLNGFADIIRSNRDNFSFIVVIPQCKEGRFWDEKALTEAKQALDDTVSDLNGDPDQLYLAGFSLGGYGVWSMAAMFPEKFAAIVPMSARVLPRASETDAVAPVIANLSKEGDPYQAFAERLGSLPVWIYHGSDDGVVSVEFSRRMSKALGKSVQADVGYTEVKGAGHEPLGFKDAHLFMWLGEQRKNRQ